MRSLILALAFAALATVATPRLHAALPDAVPYQGRVAVEGVSFTGTGQFRFALYEHTTGDFATARAQASITNGFVTSITVTDSGSGYSNAVTVSFDGGGGSGATATATVVRGVITAITVTATGTGYTSAPKVGITDPAAPTQLWNNAVGATTGALGQPSSAVSLPVVNGLYAAGLGDTALTNMAALPVSLAPAAGKRAFVRVWFNDGTHGTQLLSPDTELRAVPFAREALTAQNATNLGGLALANFARLDTANTFTHVDGFSVTGTGPNLTSPAIGATVPLSGAGTRLEFLPGYGAFRAGTVAGNQWDAANIGLFSSALGSDTTASGNYSVALGRSSTASGTNSTAMGISTTASGSFATAMGYDTLASGALSSAMGYCTTASGRRSTALGSSTVASSYAETALGSFNTLYTPNADGAWDVNDRLFVIGNGTGSTSRSDALVMLKDGDTTLNGKLALNGALSATGASTFSSSLRVGNALEVAGNLHAYSGATVDAGLQIGGALQVTGASTFSNSLQVGNALQVAGALHAYDTATVDAGLQVGGALQVAGTLHTYANATVDGSLTIDNALQVGNGANIQGRVHVSGVTGLSVSGDGPTNEPAAGATVPISGAGTRLMFLPGYGALRAGTAGGNEWDAANIGLWSTALGVHNMASGLCSFAAGIDSYATGRNSFAFGNNVCAIGNYSAAIGAHVSTASCYETVIGCGSTYYTPVSATDWNAADRLFVIGNGGTSNYSDALIVYKSGNATLQGTLTQGSDRNRKTDIVPADTAAVLAGVAALPVSTWKYKDETTTHLGPMAQDFFAAFQLGGDEKGIASVDADGVALAAIQELKKQLDAVKAQNATLAEQNAALATRLAALEAKLH